MAWQSVIGQGRVKSLLQRAILEKRIAHAYCFWGAEGVGKDALALEFAKTLNCERPLEDHHRTTITACGVCKSCTQAASLQHPNIQLIFSLPAAKSDDKTDSALLKLSDEQISLVQEQLRLKAENPYHNITLPHAAQIRIASIRDVKKSISMSASQRGRRVIIISEADAMTMEAANAFLKTLEEPHTNVTIILTSSRREQLLPTILSRCQQVRCDPLSDDDITRALQERQALPADEARLVARLADGSYSKACELIGEDLRQLRFDVVDLLRIMLMPRGYIMKLTSAIEQAVGARDRNRIEYMLTLLLLWMRDAFALSVSDNENTIINIDQVQDLKRFVQRFGSHEGLDEATRAIEHSVELLRKNVNTTLLLATLALNLRSALLRRL
jgi:DNA polymerase-3 subunit delta'